MNYNKGLTFWVLLAILVTSCSKKYYDKEKYEEMLSITFPVDNIDGTHDWSTITECTAVVGIDIEAGKTYTVKIYEDNPIPNRMGYVLLEGTVKNGASMTANFSHPKISDKLYVAVTDDSGTTYVMPVKPEHGMVRASISKPDTETMEQTTQSIYDVGFDMAFCFEDSYPQSGDYDFNDVVIGTNMTKNISDRQTVITIDLSLRAVGSMKTMAAALHIAGLKAKDVNRVECTGPLFAYYAYGLGNYKDNDNNQMFPTEQPENGYLISKYQQNDIYIPITNDVHFAMNKGRITSTGMVERINYNTVLASQKPQQGDSNNKLAGDDMSAVKGRVMITLNEGVGDKNITARNLDLFIMEDNNAVIWEVHTFTYKTKPVIFADGKYENNIFPWAIVVPGSRFRWPAEGIAIGSYRSATVMGGAYQMFGHSFGQWVTNKNTAQDWYVHPSTAMVY